ncbi:hypothetical protein ACS5PN_04750 [Roseateles sp. NT4]|uniref:hypothetical protein n=1 Tax=Roseateles sp. NT4 TaxID=3453715 RepID=UPI003EEAE726
MAASGLVIAPPAALALGLALLGWAWWGQPAVDTPPVAPAVVAPPAARPAMPERRHAPAARETPQAPALHLVGLLTAPEASLRASVMTALSQPAEGGRLYARALARRCADLAGLQAVTAPDVNDARHQSAVARRAALAAGCSQFGNGEWLGLVNVAADEAGGGDPLLAIQQSDLDDAALVQALMARPDPLLLDELGERLLLRRIDGEARLFFDGQRFDAEADRATAQAALRLLPCHFGLACDERDPEVWFSCLRGDGCVASRLEREPPEAQALASRLAAALRSRDLKRFLP